VKKVLTDIQSLLYSYGELWPQAFEAAYSAESYMIAKDASSTYNVSQKHESWLKKEAAKRNNAKNRLSISKGRKQAVNQAVQAALLRR